MDGNFRSIAAAVTPLSPTDHDHPIDLMADFIDISSGDISSAWAVNSRHSMIDRALDCLLALLIALALLPVILISIGALFASGGPVLFKQTRVGRQGRLFKVYKFRSMVPNAEQVLKELLDTDASAREEWDREFKLKNDPRITSIGRFLRKTSLDELPQLLNVALGDMSLVGPRPVGPGELERYGRYMQHYIAQRPGLTGLWQVSGRNDCSYKRRVALDAYYARNRTIYLDMIILAKTVRVVLTGRGAY